MATDPTITAEEVRQRLTTLTTADISNAVLASASMILVGDAYTNRLLTNNGLAYTDLSTDQKALLKAVKIDFVVKRVVSDANFESFSTGPIKSASVKASDKAAMIKILDDEIKELLDVAGMYPYKLSITSSGGSSYTPDGEDLTNIDFTEADSSTPFRTLP